MTGSAARPTRTRPYAVLLAAVVLLTSCAQDADTATESAAPESTSVPASTPSSPGTPATPTPTTPATPTPPATPSAPVTSPSEPVPAVPVTVTTPNGLHSFTLPAGWTAVEAEPLPILEHDVGYVTPAAFTVMDAAGTPAARFYSGVSLDGASGSSPGHILYDAQQLDGYTTKLDQPVFFQFESRPVYTNTGSGSWEVTGRGYHVELESGPLPDAGGMDSGPNYGRFIMPDGGVMFHAVIEPGAFADDAAARAWMETDTYRQLKDMMLSLTYNG